MLTPYQFASNRPIAAIDLDGLESRIVITAQYWENEINSAILDKDIGRATFLAFESITKSFDNLESAAAIEWAKSSGGRERGSPAQFVFDKDKFPKGLTVVNANGDMLFRIQDNRQETHWYDGFLELDRKSVV